MELLEKEDVLVLAAKEEQDLYDELECLATKMSDPDKMEETNREHKEKLLRYKNIMVKKSNIIKESGEKEKSFKTEY